MTQKGKSKEIEKEKIGHYYFKEYGQNLLEIKMLSI
jgi:hypothetical protein